MADLEFENFEPGLRDLDVGVLKPVPRGLPRIMELAGVETQEVLSIGDRPERDQAAGIGADVAS